MTDRQLLQQALDALIRCATDIDAHWECRSIDQIDADGDTPPIITALRDRLAHCDRCGKRLGGEGDIHTCTPLELRRFEKWWDAEDDIPNDGPYTPDTPIQFAWAGWQAALAQPEQQGDFCDLNCVWTNHHPDCKLAQPEQEPVAIALNTGTRQGVKWLKNVEHGENLYTTPPAAPMTEFEEAVAAVDNTLHHAIDHWQDKASEQAALLRECRFAIDTLIEKKPAFAMLLCGSTTLGNLKASLHDYRVKGIFDDTPPAAAQRTWVGLTDEQIKALMPIADGTAETDKKRVEVLPGVMGYEFGEVDAWSMPLVLQIARAAIAKATEAT